MNKNIVSFSLSLLSLCVLGIPLIAIIFYFVFLDVTGIGGTLAVAPFYMLLFPIFIILATISPVLSITFLIISMIFVHKQRKIERTKLNTASLVINSMVIVLLVLNLLIIFRAVLFG